MKKISASVPAGVRVLQQPRGPEKLKVFLNSLLDGKEHLVYDADAPAWLLQQLQQDAKEFVGCKVKSSSSLEWLGDIPLVYECI